MNRKYYAAYGSNLNTRQMAVRCMDAEPLGSAYIDDYSLVFKGSRTGSYLTIEENPGGTVPVVVWEVSAEDEKALDRYEGYPNFYYKTEMTLNMYNFKTGRSEEVDAFIYIMHEDRPYALPDISYINVCEEGYTDFDFSEYFLEDALIRTREKMKI